MGIRHLKARPIIHVYLEGQPIPFDVKPYRAIPFKFDNPSHVDKAKTELTAVVSEVIKPDFKVENPVTRARGREKLDETATDVQRLLLGEVQGLQERVKELEEHLNARNPPGSFFTNTPGGTIFSTVVPGNVVPGSTLVTTPSSGVAHGFSTSLGISNVVPGGTFVTTPSSGVAPGFSTTVQSTGPVNPKTFAMDSAAEKEKLQNRQKRKR